MVVTRNGVAALLMLSVVFFLSGCGGGDTHSKLADLTMAEMDKIPAIIESAKDVESAKAAVSKLESVTKTLKALKARVDKLPKASQVENDAIMEKMKSRQEELGKRMQAATMSVMSDPEVAKIIMPAMKSFSDTMNSMQ